MARSSPRWRRNRRGILACVLPGVTGRLTVIRTASWYIDGAPKRTPEFSDCSVVQDFQFVLHCPHTGAVRRTAAQVAGLTKLVQFHVFAGFHLVYQIFGQPVHRRK